MIMAVDPASEAYTKGLREGDLLDDEERADQGEFPTRWMQGDQVLGLAYRFLAAAIAVTPALAIVLLMRAALRYLREIDELQRRIETEAIGAASLLVSVLYFAGGLLEKAKVLHFDAAAAMIWVFPLLMLFYGGAKYIFTRRYL